MNKFLLSPNAILHTVFTFVLCVLICLTSVQTVRADGAPPPEPDMGGVAPYQPIETNVQMMSETVVIDVLPHPTRWTSMDNQFFTDPNQIRVNASFTLRNQGATEEKMQVIFPLTRLDYPWLTSSYNIIETSFVAHVDGKTVPTTRLTTPPELQGFPEGSEAELPDGLFTSDVQWAGFDVTFPVGQDVVVEVNYDMWGYIEMGLQHVDYILETGAGWYGRILSADIIVRLPYPASSESVPQTPAGCTFSGNEVQCKMKNFEPKRKDNLAFSFIDTNEWPPLLELRARVEQYPDDAEAWYRLAGRYDWLGFWRMEGSTYLANQHMAELSIEAYEKVVALRPDWAGAHSALASELWLNKIEGQRSRNGTPKGLTVDDPVIQRVIQELKLAASYGKFNEYLADQLNSTFPDLKLSLPVVMTPTPTPMIPTATSGPSFTSLQKVVEIAVGNYHTCVLTTDEVKCEGWDLKEEVVDDITEVAAGDLYTCMLTASGGVKCMGRNQFGQLGNGTTIDSDIPVDVAGLTTGVSALATGDNHTCALMKSGGLRCWGRNYFGQLGDGTMAYSLVPVDVRGLATGVVSLAAGNDHTCVIMQTGRVKCWGANESGQLGDGSLVNRLEPVDVMGLPDGITALAAGFDHACALTSQGQIMCWGDNSHGQLGDDDPEVHTAPVTVPGLGQMVKVAAGNGYTCALTREGDGTCWGRNDFGQLGSTTNVDSSIPIRVMGLTSAVDLAAGNNHSCALLKSGRIKCWGMSEYVYHGLEAHSPVQFDETPVVSSLPFFTPEILSTPVPVEASSPATDLLWDLALLVAICILFLILRRYRAVNKR